MRLDTSSYYPKSHLDDDDPDDRDNCRTECVSGSSGDSDVSSGVSSPASPCAGDAEDESVTDATPCHDSSTREPDLPPSELEAGVSRLAHLLSWVLVPLLMPVYGVMLAFGLSILSFTDFSVRLTFTAVVAAFNVAVPALVVLLLKRLNIVSDLGLNGQKERFLPYVVCIMSLVGTALFMHFKGAPQWLVMFFFGGAAAGIVEVIVNRWWKISVHAAGMAGIVALLLRMMETGDYMSPSIHAWTVVAVALAGLLGSARIWLGRHTLMQVFAGYAVGFSGVFLMMSLE